MHKKEKSTPEVKIISEDFQNNPQNFGIINLDK